MRAHGGNDDFSAQLFFIKFPSFLADENYVKEADAGALLLARTDSPVWRFYLYIKALSVHTCHAKFEHRFCVGNAWAPHHTTKFLVWRGALSGLESVAFDFVLQIRSCMNDLDAKVFSSNRSHNAGAGVIPSLDSNSCQHDKFK